MTGGYKVKKIYVGSRQVRPKTWKPDASRTLLYLPLEDNAIDMSGNNRATSTSGISYSIVNGVKCANTTSGGISLGTSNINWLKPTSGTYNVWICNTSYVNNCRIWEFQVQGKIGNMGVISSTNYLPRFIATGSSDTGGNIGSTSIPLNSWVNLGFVVDGGTVKAYINGNNVGSVSNSNGFGSRPASYEQGCYLFCARDGYGYSQFKGGMREFIFENIGRTDQEMSDYYNLTKSNYGL